MGSNRIIGLSGTNGAGKDAVGIILAEKYNYLFISVTDVLRDELVRRGLPPERQHMRALSAEWRREHGLSVLVDRAIEQYRTVQDRYQGVVLASLRNPHEGDAIHALGGTLIWVDADARLRYERIQKNAASRGGIRAVDDLKTFEQFLADEQAEMERPAGGDDATLNMAAVKARADMVLTNDTANLETLQERIKTALALQ